ncbi:hypothetical protein [Azospirillum doebereinerae]
MNKARFSGFASQARLINGYGPAETTLFRCLNSNGKDHTLPPKSAGGTLAS